MRRGRRRRVVVDPDASALPDRLCAAGLAGDGRRLLLDGAVLGAAVAGLAYQRVLPPSLWRLRTLRVGTREALIRPRRAPLRGAGSGRGAARSSTPWCSAWSSPGPTPPPWSSSPSSASAPSVSLPGRSSRRRGGGASNASPRFSRRSRRTAPSPLRRLRLSAEDRAAGDVACAIGFYKTRDVFSLTPWSQPKKRRAMGASCASASSEVRNILYQMALVAVTAVTALSHVVRHRPLERAWTRGFPDVAGGKMGRGVWHRWGGWISRNGWICMTAAYIAMAFEKCSFINLTFLLVSSSGSCPPIVYNPRFASARCATRWRPRWCATCTAAPRRSSARPQRRSRTASTTTWASPTRRRASTTSASSTRSTSGRRRLVYIPSADGAHGDPGAGQPDGRRHLVKASSAATCPTRTGPSSRRSSSGNALSGSPWGRARSRRAARRRSRSSSGRGRRRPGDDRESPGRGQGRRRGAGGRQHDGGRRGLRRTCASPSRGCYGLSAQFSAWYRGAASKFAVVSVGVLSLAMMLWCALSNVAISYTVFVVMLVLSLLHPKQLPVILPVLLVYTELLVIGIYSLQLYLKVQGDDLEDDDAQENLRTVMQFFGVVVRGTSARRNPERIRTGRRPTGRAPSRGNFYASRALADREPDRLRAALPPAAARGRQGASLDDYVMPLRRFGGADWAYAIRWFVFVALLVLVGHRARSETTHSVWIVCFLAWPACVCLFAQWNRSFTPMRASEACELPPRDWGRRGPWGGGGIELSARAGGAGAPRGDSESAPPRVGPAPRSDPAVGPRGCGATA